MNFDRTQPSAQDESIQAIVLPNAASDPSEWVSQAEYHIDQRESLQTLHRSVFSRTKRWMDIGGAFIGLLLTAIVTVPIAVAMQLDHPGPIFYGQIRTGLKGKPFRIWKFRSMVIKAEEQQHLVNNEVNGYLFKNKNDPRVTRVGKFLRRTSLDEFPQFWNVLKGEMSLVGTRPPTPKEVANYTPYHHRRLLVKPGMTGEWQVNGRSWVKNFEDVVKMDLEYQQKWSIVYDCTLIMKTIGVVFRGEGAC